MAFAVQSLSFTGIRASLRLLAPAALLVGLALAPAGCGTRSIEPGSSAPETAVGQGTYGLHGRLRLAFLEGVGCTLCELDRPLVPGLTQRLGVVEVLDEAMPARLRLESSAATVLTVPDRMMDGTELRDFSVQSLEPGQAELRFYTGTGELYDVVTLTVEAPRRVALQLAGDPPAIEESETLQLQVGDTVALQPVALSKAGQVMQSRAFALEVDDAGVAGFAAFGLAGEGYAATRSDAGTLVARQPGQTVLRLTTAGAFRDYRITVSR